MIRGLLMTAGVVAARALVPIPQTPRPTCVCADDVEVALLRDLIALGIPQWDASIVVFGDGPTYGASPLARKVWARLQVMRLANTARRSLGLPEVSLNLILEQVMR